MHDTMKASLQSSWTGQEQLYYSSSSGETPESAWQHLEVNAYLKAVCFRSK